MRYAGIGMFTKDIDGKTFVTARVPRFAGRQGRAAAGDEIVSADGAPFEPIGSFRNKVGETVTLKVRRDGRRRRRST